MFRHKPRADEIPDFKQFLEYLHNKNPELHSRYTKEVRKALIADIFVFACFVAAVFAVIVVLVDLATVDQFTSYLIVGIVSIFVFIAVMVVASVFGRRGHAAAVRIETEIVTEYHRSGFAGPEL